MAADEKQIVPKDIQDDADILYLMVAKAYTAELFINKNKPHYIIGRIDERIKNIKLITELLSSQSFEGWSEDAIKGYNTAKTTILKFLKNNS